MHCAARCCVAPPPVASFSQLLLPSAQLRIWLGEGHPTEGIAQESQSEQASQAERSQAEVEQAYREVGAGAGPVVLPRFWDWLLNLLPELALLALESSQRPRRMARKQESGVDANEHDHWSGLISLSSQFPPLSCHFVGIFSGCLPVT